MGAALLRQIVHALLHLDGARLSADLACRRVHARWRWLGGWLRCLGRLLRLFLSGLVGRLRGCSGLLQLATESRIDGQSRAGRQRPHGGVQAHALARRGLAGRLIRQCQTRSVDIALEINGVTGVPRCTQFGLKISLLHLGCIRRAGHTRSLDTIRGARGSAPGRWRCNSLIRGGISGLARRDLIALGRGSGLMTAGQQRRASARNPAQGCAHTRSRRYTLGWINRRIEWDGRPLTLVLRDAFLNSLLSRLARPRLRRACNSSASKPLATSQETLRAKRAADPADNGRDDAGAATCRDSLILRGASILGKVVGCAGCVTARHRRASRNTASLSRALDTLRAEPRYTPEGTSTLYRRARPNERTNCLGCCKNRVANDVPAYRAQLIHHAVGAVHLLLKALLFGLNDRTLLGFAGLDDVLVDPAGDSVAGLDEVGSGRDPACRRIGNFDHRIVYGCSSTAAGLLAIQRPIEWLQPASRRPVKFAREGLEVAFVCHPPTLKERCGGGRTLGGAQKMLVCACP